MYQCRIKRPSQLASIAQPRTICSDVRLILAQPSEIPDNLRTNRADSTGAALSPQGPQASVVRVDDESRSLLIPRPRQPYEGRRRHLLSQIAFLAPGRHPSFVEHVRQSPPSDRVVCEATGHSRFT